MKALPFFARALLVVILALSYSQALALVVPEPCGITETADAGDGQCSPTCVRCGCCSQPVETAPFRIAVQTTPLSSSASVVTLDLLPSISRDILHVPKA